MKFVVGPIAGRGPNTDDPRRFRELFGCGAYQHLKANTVLDIHLCERVENSMKVQ